MTPYMYWFNCFRAIDINPYGHASEQNAHMITHHTTVSQHHDIDNRVHYTVIFLLLGHRN